MFDDESFVQRVSPEDREDIQHVLTAFSDPKTERGELNRLANTPEILALEKKYVPVINQERLPVIECDVLVCPVGFRPVPVILTSLMLKPEAIYLLHSIDSRQYAEMIRDDPDIQSLGLDPNHNIHLREISLTNAPDNYEVLQEIVNQSPNRQIVVDVTGGVKVMGVSLAAAAFWQRLPVIYLFGEEVKGIIKPFTERLNLLQNPYDHFGDTEFKLLKGFFDTNNYDAALRICISLRDTVGDVTTLGALNILIEFIEIYRDWDAFAHSQSEDVSQRKLATRLRVLIGKLDRLKLEPAPRAQLQDNLSFLETIENSWQKNKRNIADECRLVDIFCAAERRAKAGKYDDAIARLYRCLEMSATILLVDNWDIGNPRKPSLKRFRDEVGGAAALKEQFQKLANYDLPESLGLDAQMKLLELGGKHKQVTGIYRGMSTGSPSLMEWRNRSTLAHGTVPVSQQTYEQFSRRTKEIISWVVGKQNFGDLLKQATHPSLTLPKR